MAAQRAGRIGRPLTSVTGPGCPKKLLEEAMDTPNGALVRRCFRILNAKSIGLTITLADITEEVFRVLTAGADWDSDRRNSKVPVVGCLYGIPHHYLAVPYAFALAEVWMDE